MEALKVFVGLTEEEVQLFDESVREKLVIAFDSLQNDVTRSKEKLDSLETERENAIQEYNKTMQELEKKCSSFKEQSSEYECLLQSSDVKFREAYAEKSQLQAKLDDAVSINNELNFAIRNLENEKDILSDQLKHRIEFGDMLNKELQELKTEAESVRKMKIEALLKMEEVTSKESILKAQETRWSEEVSALQRHIQWLEERLSHATDQLQTVRRDTTNKAQSLESELELRKTELENARKTISNLEESVRKLTTANENYIEKVKQVAEEQIRIEQLYGNELDAQKQVVSLYKDQLKEAEDKNTELTDAVASMQGMLKSAYENISRLESDKTNLKQQFCEERARLESTSQRLSAELEQSRQLLDKFRVDGLSEDELRQLNPAVAATLSALKRGHSLTQLYSDYIQLVEDRDQLRLDKQRLTEYVKQLVDDLKEKAPVLRDQQNRYQKMQSQVKELSAQLDAINGKLEESEAKRQEMQRRAGYYQRESGRLKQTCGDLSKQVQFLLREVEVLRGTVVEEPNQDSPDSTETLNKSQIDKSITAVTDLDQLFTNVNSSAALVIDEHLVTWRGLQELQSQNQRLLCVARDLATQLEQREQEEKKTAAHVSDLTLRVENLSGELDVVRTAASKARSETQVVTRQRDLYRALLKQYDIEVSKLEDEQEQDKTVSDTGNENAIDVFDPHSRLSSGARHPEKNSSYSTPTGANMKRLEESLASLDAEFKRYREDKTESDKIYSNTIEQLRKEYSEARLLNQKLAAQLDFTHEKLRILEANVSGYKQEITVLREMNARYSTSAAASEAELARLRDDLLRTSDKLLETEVDARHAARQLELARANEARWKQENEALRRQDHMHTQLMHQLEAIQGNLEQRESNDRATLERRVTQLETQLTESQSAFMEASQSCKSIKETLGHELEVARQNLAVEQAEAEQLRVKLNALEQELKESQPKRDTEKGAASEESSEPLIHETAIESASRIRELQLEIDGLHARLDAARRQTEQMRELSTESETRLNEMMEENKQLEERLSQKLNESEQRCEFLEAQLDLEKKERQNLVNENIRTTEQAHQMNAELRRELANLQSELESTKARCESALQLEAGAKSKIEEHERLAQEARQKYERELALHAQDVDALSETRKQAEEARALVADLQHQCSTAETKAQTAVDELKAQNALWDSERETLNSKLQQADKDQSLLQEQLVKLTQQLISLRKAMEKSDNEESLPGPSSKAVDESSGLSDLKTSEDLLQLVSYLRRQKSIAEASCDASSAEISRLLLRISSLEQQKEHLQSELDKERKASEMAAETAQRHTELMQRVEQLNLVTESNRLLRHERETLRNNLTEVEKQLEVLRATVSPLREENDSLQARVDSLISDLRSVEEERDRWKERCNRLVETAQRMDPEQYRLACNERDELQRKVRRTEEELQHAQSKVGELRAELEERVKKFEEDLTEANTSRQDAENRCSEYNATCASLRKDLESRDTTVVKLREIARKYRQEAETLRRQLAVNRSDEVRLQSLNEALTEARADVVTLKADLSTVRAQNSQLTADHQEISQLIEQLKSNASFAAILANAPTPTTSESADNPIQSVVRTLRTTFHTFSTELDRLHQQAEAQRERLLRLMLVESQLNKALRENAELRSRVTELQSSQHIRQVQSTTPSESDTADPSYGFNATNQMRTPLTTTVAPEPSAVDVTLGQDSGSVAPSARPISHSQPVIPAWMMRAAATASAMQPVPPTPAVTPPNSVSMGSKQTAEIRPITSNVATVIPTPALQPVQTISLATPSDSLSAPVVQVSPALAPNTQEGGLSTTSVVSNVHATMDQQNLFRTDPVSGGAVRNTSARRPASIMGQSTSGDPQSVATTTSLPFGWLSSPSAQVGSTVLATVSGKRRLEETTTPCDTVGIAHTHTEETNMTSIASPDTPRSWEVQTCSGHTAPSGFPFLFSEAKRLRQTGTTVPMSTTQAGPSTVVVGRQAFGQSSTAGQALQTASSRLFPSQSDHTADAWNTVTASVTGIVNPLTPVMPSVSITSAPVPVDASVSSSTSITSTVQLIRPAVAGDSSEPDIVVSRDVPEQKIVSQLSSEIEVRPNVDTSSEVSTVASSFEPPTLTSELVQHTQASEFVDASANEPAGFRQPLIVHEEEQPNESVSQDIGMSSHAIEHHDSTVPVVETTESRLDSETCDRGVVGDEEVAAATATVIGDEGVELTDGNNVEDAGECDGIEEEYVEDEEYQQHMEFENEIEPYSEEEEPEDEEIDEAAPVDGGDEVIELSSDSENSEDTEEDAEDYEEEDTQQSEKPDIEEETSQAAEAHAATDNTEPEELPDQDDEISHDGDSASADDEAEEDEYAACDNSGVTPSHADTEAELAEHAEEGDQSTNDVPTTASHPSSLEATSTNSSIVSSSTASNTSGSNLFSGLKSSSLFSTVTATTGNVGTSALKPSLFSTSDTIRGPTPGSGGLFSEFHPSPLSTTLQQKPKFGSVSSTGTGGDLEQLAASSSSTGGLFKQSAASNPPQSSTAASSIPKTLLGHSTPASIESGLSATTATTTENNKPKIQPIVWDSTLTPGPSVQPNTEETSRVGIARRKKWGSTGRTGLFAGKSASSTASSTFGPVRGAGSSKPGSLRTNPHPRR